MIAIIDVDHILYMCLNGIKRLDEFGEPIKEDNKFVYDPKPFVQACEEADKYILQILNKTKAVGYIGFIGGTSKRRKSIKPDYKENRKDFKKPDNFDLLFDYLVFNWNFQDLRKSEHETDDYVASSKKQVLNSFIISPDKDLLNLEGKHYNPIKDLWISTNKDQAEYYFWKSMVIGDTSDGVKGIPTKGEKFFETISQGIIWDQLIFKVFNSYINYFGDKGIDEFYKNYHCLKILDNLPIEDTVMNFNF